MANLEVISTTEHYVVQIKVEQVKRELVRDTYSKTPHEAKRSVDEIVHLVFKDDNLYSALNSAINHVSLLKDDK